MYYSVELSRSMDKIWWIVLYRWRVWVMRFQRIEQPKGWMQWFLMNWPYSTLEQPQTESNRCRKVMKSIKSIKIPQEAVQTKCVNVLFLLLFPQNWGDDGRCCCCWESWTILDCHRGVVSTVSPPGQGQCLPPLLKHVPNWSSASWRPGRIQHL